MVKDQHNTISPEQRMWQQRDQELAMIRERERAAKEKERQRREREGIWPSGVGGIGGGVGLLNDHIELDKESYSYVQFAREGKIRVGKAPLRIDKLHLKTHDFQVFSEALAWVAWDCIPSARIMSTATR